jgi:hypothetical protein
MGYRSWRRDGKRLNFQHNSLGGPGFDDLDGYLIDLITH